MRQHMNTISAVLRVLGLCGIFTSTNTFVVDAFVVVGPSKTTMAQRGVSGIQQSTTTKLYMSEPSDTSTDDDDFYEYQDVVNVDAEDYTPTASEALVSNVMDLIPSTLGDSVSAETRTAVNEALYKLEALNPTKEPTVSPLLNGVWSLRYVGGYAPEWALTASPTRDLALFLYSGGYSPGIFALNLASKLPASIVDVGDLEISISRSQPRVEASITVQPAFGSESTVKVASKLEVESDVRLRETYESATVFDRNVPIPSMLQYSRDLYVTYLDEDLLVVRDGSGIPEVLTRKEKTFSQNWGVEPSSLDDMNPPGEETTYSM